MGTFLNEARHKIKGWPPKFRSAAMASPALGTAQDHMLPDL
jgi:hypothetical protein